MWDNQELYFGTHVLKWPIDRRDRKGTPAL